MHRAIHFQTKFQYKNQQINKSYFNCVQDYVYVVYVLIAGHREKKKKKRKKKKKKKR